MLLEDLHNNILGQQADWRATQVRHTANVQLVCCDSAFQCW
jgi:hypothetical protein